MDRRTPLQHLLRSLMPSRGQADLSTPDFLDTRPEGPRAVSPLRAATPPRQSGGWSESAIDLVLGTEIMEYPEDTAADLMDEYFDNSHKRAA